MGEHMQDLVNEISFEVNRRLIAHLGKEGVTVEDIQYFLANPTFAKRVCADLRGGRRLYLDAIQPSRPRRATTAINRIEEEGTLLEICLRTKGKASLKALSKLSHHSTVRVALEHEDPKIIAAALKDVHDYMLETWICNMPKGSRHNAVKKEWKSREPKMKCR